MIRVLQGDCREVLRGTLSDLRCSCCGSPDVVLIDPGDEEVRDLFLLKRGRPVTARCMACWPVVQQAEVAQP